MKLNDKQIGLLQDILIVAERKGFTKDQVQRNIQMIFRLNDKELKSFLRKHLNLDGWKE